MSYLSENILRLRETGASYTEIASELGCSKGTVSYHLGSGQKQKTADNQRRNRSRSTLVQKTERFKSAIPKEANPISSKDHAKSFAYKAHSFQLTANRKRNTKFSYEDVLEILGPEPICYLSGRKLDLSDPSSFHFDHKQPRTRGGDNSLENLGVATKAANKAKDNLTESEFLELCKDVLVHHGFEVVNRAIIE